MSNTLMSVAAFDGLLNKITKTGGVLNARIQIAAVTAVGYSIVHGDVRPANRLLVAMPKGTRRDALVKWMEVHGHVAYMKGDKKFAHFKTAAEFDEAKLMKAPWYGAKKEAEPTSVYDVSAEFDKFVERIEKSIERLGSSGETEVQHADLVKALKAASGQYHAMLHADAADGE